MSIPGNNGDTVPTGPSPIVFQEWTYSRTFSYLKFSLTKRRCILKGNLYLFFSHVHKDKLIFSVLIIIIWRVMEKST